MKYQWNDMHSSLLIDFCKSLEHNRIRYFILRNHEELPENNNGKDVDIVFEPGKYRFIKLLLLDILNKYNIQYYEVTKFDRMRCWYIMDLGQQFALHIDLIENEVYKGFEFFSFDELYSHTIKYKDFSILDKTYDTVLLLVQNLVAYKSLKNKYRTTIKANYEVHKAMIDDVLIDFWGKSSAEFLAKNISEDNFDEIVRNAYRLEKKAKLRIIVKKPLKCVRNISVFLLGKAYRIVWCPRKFWKFIAVEAPDGAGKTTFIDNVVDKLSFYYISDPVRFQIHHFRPRLLPNLGAVGEMVGIGKPDDNFVKPHRAKSVGLVSSLIRMTYYWLDYVIGIPIILRKEVQYERYTIFDRYIFDFLIDPCRSRINLPHAIRCFYVKLCIKPQLVFILDADADIIYSRKQELTKDEIERQLCELRNLVDNKKGIFLIDASKSPEEMADQAISIILNKFMNETKLQ